MHGCDKVLVGLALEHVTRGAGLQRLEQVALVVVHRENQHARVGEVRTDLASRLQPGQPRHPDIENAEVRTRGQRLLDCLDPVCGLRHDLETRLALEQQLDSRPDDAVVVGHQDPDHGNVSSTRVPRSGSDQIDS